MPYRSVFGLTVRVVLCIMLAPLLPIGCSSTPVVTPTQAGGTANKQQTGGLQKNTSVQVTPQINVATSSQPASVNQPTNQPQILPP